MIRTLFFSHSSNDGTSFYRGAGPLIELQHDGVICIDYANANEPADWDTVMKYSLCVFQRPCSVQDVYNVILAKQLDKKIIVDFDDLLTKLNVDNPLHNIYMDEQIHKNISFFLNNADIVTVSTEYLKNQIQPLTSNKNIIVVQNALNDKIFRLPDHHSGSKNLIWRGSPTHTRDLYHLKDEIISIGKKNKITFIGSNPKFITDHIEYIHYEYTSLIHYYSLLKNRAWGIGIVPLHDNHFNRSKSCIAFIEYTYAGAVTIAPDWDEWRKPGVLNYRNGKELKQLVQACAASPQMMEDNFQLSKGYIESELLLSKVNEERKKIILAF